MTRWTIHTVLCALVAAMFCGAALAQALEAPSAPVPDPLPNAKPPLRPAIPKKPVKVLGKVNRGQGNSVAQHIRDIQNQSFTPQHRESISKRKAGERRQSKNLHEYVDKTGVMTFTNRPDKYDHNRLYTPVDISYQPIVVPNEYRRFKSVQQYTTKNISTLISHYANQNGLDENLVYAMIKAESDFNTNAISPAGACGLMQLMPGTAAEMGVTQIFDPAQNIAGGTEYVAKMLSIFNNDSRLALAAYNAGPNAVQQYGGIPPYQETQQYVERVLGYQQGFAKGGVPARSTGLRTLHTAKVGPNVRPANPGGGKAFVVYFHSGLTQPADRVVDKDPYYYIEYGNLVYPVRKDLVQRIAQS